MKRDLSLGLGTYISSLRVLLVLVGVTGWDGIMGYDGDECLLDYDGTNVCAVPASLPACLSVRPAGTLIRLMSYGMACPSGRPAHGYLFASSVFLVVYSFS